MPGTKPNVTRPLRRQCRIRRCNRTLCGGPRSAGLSGVLCRCARHLPVPGAALHASSRPNLLTLAVRIRDPAKLFAIRPFETLWKALSGHFRDPRLRQLFARYATYNGASPYAAPATLMLIAHVEQNGVWEIVGGMQRLAEALTKLATAKQVVFRFGCEARRIMVSANRASGVELASGERLEADAIVVNADAAALAIGLFGAQAAAGVAPLAPRQRSLSAVTWAMVARAEGFALHRHNVFFSRDYATEFDDIFLRAAADGSHGLCLRAGPRRRQPGQQPGQAARSGECAANRR